MYQLPCEEGEKGKESKKSRVKRKTPERDRGDGNGSASLEALIRGFREETCRAMEDLKREERERKIQGDEVREEVRKVRENWENWNKLWKEGKEKVWRKLESIENR